MMLPAARVLRQEAVQRRILSQRLDQLDLAVGGIDEAHPHPLRRQVERLVDLGRAQHVAIERDALLDRWGGDPDMVQAAQFHPLLRKPRLNRRSADLPATRTKPRTSSKERRGGKRGGKKG